MTEWTKKKYDEYYNAYVPWLEDKYLAWFGENKTSYTAKGKRPLSPLLYLPPPLFRINSPYLPTFFSTPPLPHPALSPYLSTC